jgi:hypothetical protein
VDNPFAHRSARGLDDGACATLSDAMRCRGGTATAASTACNDLRRTPQAREPRQPDRLRHIENLGVGGIQIRPVRNSPPPRTGSSGSAPATAQTLIVSPSGHMRPIRMTAMPSPSGRTSRIDGQARLRAPTRSRQSAMSTCFHTFWTLLASGPVEGRAREALPATRGD